MAVDLQDNFNERLQQREAIRNNPLQTNPTSVELPGGNIPNTLLAVSAIAFLLGAVFSLGALTFMVGGFDTYWWSTAQFGFFVAAWAAFHWGEFAVTAGWNFEKCSVDCERVYPWR